MWPILLDMSKVECKKSLRQLELDAYAAIVNAFRAQGDLNEKKCTVLKDLQLIFRITIDRHKAECRRAMNDERLHTIAKRLSCGESVSSEWIKQSKRFVPLLPSLETETDSYYRLLADHLLNTAMPVLSMYPDPPTQQPSSLNDLNEEKDEQETTKENSLINNNSNNNKACKKLRKRIRMEKEELINSGRAKIAAVAHLNSDVYNLEDEESSEKHVVYLKNGYAVESKFIKGKNKSTLKYILKFILI
jgi:hypothetical protein